MPAPSSAANIRISIHRTTYSVLRRPSVASWSTVSTSQQPELIAISKHPYLFCYPKLCSGYRVKGRIMKIGEASRLSGCHIETIRYYERVGILSPTARSENGYRRYADHHIQQLRFILHARELGFSLDDI